MLENKELKFKGVSRFKWKLLREYKTKPQINADERRYLLFGF
jgi:hypothetical protein